MLHMYRSGFYEAANHQDASKHARYWTESATFPFNVLISAAISTQTEVRESNHLVVSVAVVFSSVARKERCTSGDEFPDWLWPW